MSFYQNIKNFGKKILLIGGLATILSGCAEIEYKTSQIFKDLNNDGKPEQVYLLKGKKHWDYRDYDLMVREGKEEGFGEPKLLQKFKNKPIEIKIEDIDGDGNQDLLIY